MRGGGSARLGSAQPGSARLSPARLGPARLQQLRSDLTAMGSALASCYMLTSRACRSSSVSRRIRTLATPSRTAITGGRQTWL